MYRYLIILVLSIFVLKAGYYPKHQAGLGGSFISGAGINYIYESDPDNVYKISAFMYYQGDNSDERDIYADLGIEYQRNLIKSKYHRFYALIGGSWWNFHEKTYDSYYKNDVLIETRTSDFNRIYNFGLGAGYEYRWRRVSISLDAGLMLQNSLNDNFSGFFNKSEGEMYIGPSVGLSLRFIIK